MDDPIVAEVHAARERIAAEHGNDLHKLCRYFRDREREHPERMVSIPRKNADRKDPGIDRPRKQPPHPFSPC